MATSAHLVQAGQIGNDAQMRDTTRMCDGGADVIDELLFDQIFAIPHRVENFAHGQWCGGVIPNELERFLVFCGR